jgi:hypothetical protein
MAGVVVLVSACLLALASIAAANGMAGKNFIQSNFNLYSLRLANVKK